VTRTATLALCAVALTACGDRASVHTTQGRVPFGESLCLSKSDRARLVAFDSTSRARLTAVVLGQEGAKRGAVLLHQSGGDLCQWLPYGHVLSARGYQVVALDLNGNGGSTIAPGSPSTPHWDRDVRAAVDLLRSRGARRIVVMGASMGGTVAVASAAQLQPRVTAVVDVSGPTEISGLDARAAAKRLGIAALYVVSRDDDFYASVRDTYRATPAAERSLLVVPGNDHGVGLLNTTIDPAAPRVLRTIGAFLDEHVRA
jgi:pimeloyl-ACP methyl ester carboxylesterase